MGRETVQNVVGSFRWSRPVHPFLAGMGSTLDLGAQMARVLFRGPRLGPGGEYRALRRDYDAIAADLGAAVSDDPQEVARLEERYTLRLVDGVEVHAADGRLDVTGIRHASVEELGAADPPHRCVRV